MNLEELSESMRALPQKVNQQAQVHGHSEMDSLRELVREERSVPIFAGIPVVVDPSVPEDHIRFKHPDGRVEDFPLTGRG